MPNGPNDTLDASDWVRPRVIILSGPSGTGKTRHRLNSLKHLPFVDIADVYREIPDIGKGYEATLMVWNRVKRLLDGGAMQVVVEGYFLKKSVSRNDLIHYAHQNEVEVQVLNFWAPLETCEKRIRLQRRMGDASTVEAELRISMLHKCWRPKGE